MSNSKVLLFGDSILNCSQLPKNSRLITLIKKKFISKKRKILFKIIGLNGYTSKKAFFYLKKKKIKDYFNVAIIQFGVNDSWHFKSLNGKANVKQKDFRKYMIKILKILKKRVNKIYISTYHKLAKKRLEVNNKTVNQNLEKYNKIIRTLKNKKKNIYCLDFERKTFSRRNKICLPKPDEVHLSKIGSEVYSKIIYKEILKNNL